MAGVKGHDTTRRDGDFLPSFWIPARTLRFVTQLKISEARQLYAVTGFQGVTDFLKKSFDHVFGLALVETDSFEKQISEFGFG